MAACPRCGHPAVAGHRFCGACGAPLARGEPEPSREERKRISVLFCDLVGFTGRAETMDPEEVRALLRPYHGRVRQELERHGATVEKFIGDAVVGIFGAPVTHEDDPERAVRAALAVREAIADPEGGRHVRIGVTTGEALVALDARPELGEGVASGDVVNTAARLQALAPIDGVLVDETTWRATRSVIDYRDRAAVAAKGKTDPVPVWEAAGVRSRLGMDVAERAATPLIGRRRELGVLASALERARTERTSHLVTLVGPPGIGKSRLVLELLREVRAGPDPVRWRQGRCLPYGDGLTLSALAEIVKAHTGVLETDPVDVVRDRLAAAIRAVVPDVGEADWVERHLRPLVGLEGDGSIAGEHRDEAFTAWRRFLEGIAELGPLVLVVEDLQWADDTTLDFLDHLVDWTVDVPLLVVATARSELLARRAAWGGGKANSVIQSLPPLTDAETAALAGAVLRTAPLSEAVQRALVERSEGNPLYVEEFARMLQERDDGTVDGAAVPASVHGIIAARLDTLDPRTKDLLHAAAAVGKVFWLSALEALLPEDRAGLERRLHELERRQLVRRDRQSVVAAERQYVFRHLLVREVAYGQIPRRRRAELHASVARWIERLAPDRTEDRSEMLAHHWSTALRFARASGRETGDLGHRARSALLEAGDRALRINAPARAAGFFARALELGSDPDTLLRHGRSLYLAGEVGAEEALSRAQAALSRSGDRAGQAFCGSMLGHLAWLAGDAAVATRMVTDAADLARGLPPSEVKARVMARAAAMEYVSGRWQEAMALAREGLALATELGLEELRVHAMATLGTARLQAGDDDGRTDLERAIAIGVAARTPESGRAAHNLGVQEFLIGDVARFRSLVTEGLAYDERFGDPAMARFAEGILAGADYFVGEWDLALERMDRFLAASRERPHYLDGLVAAHRALIRLARGDVDGARADAERVFHGLARATDPQVRAGPLGAVSRVLVELDDPRAGPVAAEALGTRLGSRPEPTSLAVLSGLRLPAEAEERRQSTLGDPSLSSRWLDAARAANEGRDLDAAALWAAMPFPAAEADARTRAAKRLLTEARREAALEQLERAAALWRAVGATRYVERVEAIRATATR